MSERTSALVNPMRIGTFGDGDYTEVEKTGFQQKKGDARGYDDAYVFFDSAAAGQIDGYVLKQFRNDGGTTEFALSFNNAGGIQLPDYTRLDNAGGSYTVDFWMRRNLTARDVLCVRNGQFQIDVRNNGQIGVEVGDTSFSWSSASINEGAWNYICVVMTAEGANLRVKTYINNVLANEVVKNFQFTASTEPVYFCQSSSGTARFSGEFDETLGYNVALTTAQIAERWNSGSGTSSLPTGITLSTDVTWWLKVNEGSGSDLTNSATGTGSLDASALGSYSWTTGSPIGGTGSIGVYQPALEPNVKTGGRASISPSHDWALETNWLPHVHISSKDGFQIGDKISLVLEYTVAQIGSVFPLTTTDKINYEFSEVVAPYEHAVISFTDIDMTGVNKVSPHMPLTLFREGDDATNDTYASDVYLLNFGTHYVRDTEGSREAFVK